MIYKYKLGDINSLKLNINKGDIVYLNGDLGAGKTTLSKHIINNLLGIKDLVTSPTYTYYNKYLENIYHFDLYRLNNYDEFFNIGGEEIIDNPNNISIIEWPDIIKDYIRPTKEIYLRKTNNENERELELVVNNK